MLLLISITSFTLSVVEIVKGSETIVELVPCYDNKDNVIKDFVCERQRNKAAEYIVLAISAALFAIIIYYLLIKEY